MVSHDLFDLIHSLSKTEKAYFKKHSTAFLREEGNNYLDLFKAIESQQSYDEQKIIARFKGRKFTRQLAVAKNYLYNRILETMRSYHHSAPSQVHGLMDRSEYLFEKGLYDQAEKQLRVAEKIARRHELHSTLISIDEHLRFDQSLKKREPRNAERNIQQAEEQVYLLQNHMHYQKLLAQVQHVYNRYGRTNNKKYLLEFRRILKNPLLKSETRALTFSGKRRFYDIHAVYNSALGHEEKAYHFSRKVIALFDSYPEKKKYSPIQYAGYINNTLVFCQFLRKYGEAPAYLEKLKELEPGLRSKYQKARLFEICLNNYLNLQNATGRFDQAKRMLPDLTKQIAEHEKKLSDRDRLMIYGNMAHTFFGLHDFKNCLTWINRIRNELPVNIRPDFESEIQLLNIIVHREMGHTDLVPHLVNAYYRFLEKKQLVTKPEKYLLNFFKKIPAGSSETQVVRRMTELRDQITAFLERKGAYNPFFFDITSWLESKIEKRSFAEVVQEKAKKYLA